MKKGRMQRKENARCFFYAKGDSSSKIRARKFSYSTFHVLIAIKYKAENNSISKTDKQQDDFKSITSNVIFRG